MGFQHTHTITIQHTDGSVEKIAVDSGRRALRDLPAGTSVPLHTREETTMNLPADWVFSADKGLTFFGSSEGPFKHAKYSVDEEPAMALDLR